MKEIKYFLLINCVFYSCLLNAFPGKENGSRRAIDSLLNILEKDFGDMQHLEPSESADAINTLKEVASEYIDLVQYKKALNYLLEAEKIARNSNNKKEIVTVLNSIGDVYEKQNNYDVALEYYQIALTFNRESGDKKRMEKSFSYIGSVYFYMDNYAMALENYQKSLKISEEQKNKKGVAETYKDIGDIYWYQGNYEDALAVYLQSLAIYEKLGDLKGLANSYYNVGYIYLYQANYKRAMDIFLKQLEISEKAGSKDEMANAYNGIGDVSEKQANYTVAVENYTKCIKLFEEIKDSLGIASAYGNIGTAYLHQGAYSKALMNYMTFLKMSRMLNDKVHLGDAYCGIGEVYKKQNKAEEALYNLNQALSIYKEIKYNEGIKDACSSLAELYERTGDYKQAYIYHTLFSDLKDTLFNEQSNKQIAEMSAKYESEKKEKDIELLTKDKALQHAELGRQKFIRNGFVAGLIISFLLAMVLYNRYITKQRLNIALSNKNEELFQKNELIELQKEKIIDSINYAQRIQQSILMEENEIRLILPDLFVYYQPKDIVSGDFYWCSAIEGRIILAAADCTGHGVPGAFMSMIGNTLLNQIVNEKRVIVPAEILHLLNLGIVEALHQEKDNAIARDGMDIALCSIDLQNGILEYAGAQSPLYIVADNILEVVKADSKTIGNDGFLSQKVDLPGVKYTNHMLPIKKDMCIYLFSDGYKDQFRSSDRKKFGSRQFKELLLQNCHLDMQRQKEIIIAEQKNWQGDMQQIDDILVIGVRFT
jgi:tetratricopeptide (TPR) repeat protein